MMSSNINTEFSVEYLSYSWYELHLEPVRKGEPCLKQLAIFWLEDSNVWKLIANILSIKRGRDMALVWYTLKHERCIVPDSTFVVVFWLNGKRYMYNHDGKQRLRVYNTQKPSLIKNADQENGILNSLFDNISDEEDAGRLILIRDFGKDKHPITFEEKIKDIEHQQDKQYIYTTHKTNIMNTLKTEQLYIYSHKNDGSEELYWLYQFKLKKHQDVERSYLLWVFWY